MWRKPLQRLVSWIGILLVLLNVLAPTVAHAVRHQNDALSQRHQQTVLAMAGDWCATAGQVSAAELRTLSQVLSLSDTLAHLKACDFCSDAPLTLALPVPEQHTDFSPLTFGPERFAAYAALLLQRPAYQLPGSRAPPRG